jgi:hypothetical protein
LSTSEKRRHLIIPDTQARPGVPLDHYEWIGQAIVDYMPDVVVHLGDHWDFPSLSTHDKPGSLKLEGARYEDDARVGRETFDTLSAPMFAEIKRQSRNKKKRWNPERHFLFGNHEDRVTRAINSDPKMSGCIGLHHCATVGFKRHAFLERLWIDGIVYSHYFQSSHSKFAIGGSIDNRLNKVGESFVQGHQQGMLYGNRVYPTGRMRHGLIAGSCYLHEESYRGAQGQQHFRGIVVLNEVHDGDYSIMPLTLDYLCRKYTGKDLIGYMKKKYPKKDWSYLGYTRS